jgi:hypothetical protein
MTRYVVFNILTGAIRCVLTGDLATAEANVRNGEAMVQVNRYVSATKHRVENNEVVDI